MTETDENTETTETTETNGSTEQYHGQYHGLPRDERAALHAVLDARTPLERAQALDAYAALRRRKRLDLRRRGEDDRYRRTMLAIHVPFDYAEQVRDAADREGVSVYRFMRRALDAAMARL